MTNGCTGDCCIAFYLPYTITEVRRGISADGKRLRNAEQIADMLIPLTPKQANERRDRLAVGPAARARWKHRHRHFTCRHWNEDTRLCGIYDERPRMCRDYPYGKEGGCDFGCECVGEPQE